MKMKEGSNWSQTRLRSFEVLHKFCFSKALVHRFVTLLVDAKLIPKYQDSILESAKSKLSGSYHRHIQAVGMHSEVRLSKI